MNNSMIQKSSIAQTFYFDLDIHVRRIHNHLHNWAMDTGDEQGIPPWDELSVDSRIMGQASLLRHMMLPVESLSVEENHRWWRDWALKNNWVVGEKYNDSPGFKTNPRLVPFEDLNKERKMYSDIVISMYRLIIPQLQASHGIYPGWFNGSNGGHGSDGSNGGNIINFNGGIQTVNQTM